MVRSDRWQCPDWLIGDAVAEWEDVVAELRSRGRLDALTLPAVAAYCQILAQYKSATAFLVEHGSVVETRNDKGVVTSQVAAPELGIQIKMLDKLRAFWKDFGMLEDNAGKESGPHGQEKNTLGRESTGDLREQLRSRLAAAGRGGHAG